MVLEALSILKIGFRKNLPVLYYLSACNLLNAWYSQNKNKVVSPKDRMNYKQCYSFKMCLADFISAIIETNLKGCNVYIEGYTILIEIEGFQFSFHHLPLNKNLSTYRVSENNIPITWSGRKLQALAPLVFNYAIAIMENLR